MLISRLRERGLVELVRFGYRVAAVAVRNPREALDHIGTQIALAKASGTKLPLEADADWQRSLHQRLGTSWPCEVRHEFGRLWETMLEEAAGSELGLSYDADPTLAEAVWCIVRHARPQVVVETGVSRGVTSRTILEAFAKNGGGHLWSIDLPPLEQPWRRLAGSAVPDRLRDRWTYVSGTSRRRLGDVCRSVGTVDLFVHDSLHTPGNLRFELETVWPYLRNGRAVVIDDAEECRAVEIVGDLTSSPMLAARQELKDVAIGLAFASNEEAPAPHDDRER